MRYYVVRIPLLYRGVLVHRVFDRYRGVLVHRVFDNYRDVFFDNYRGVVTGTCLFNRYITRPFNC